jgi:hypothetical protein
LGAALWVVNVISDPDPNIIVPAAVKLMENGYAVYITTATIKGREWMRLRTGFFDDQAKAKDTAERIGAILNTRDAWLVQIGTKEFEEFAGY